MALVLKAQGQRPARLDHDLIFGRIARQVIPRFPGRQEKEAQVVHVAIGLAVFDQPRIVLGPFSPPSVARMPKQNPEHSPEKSFAPVGPGFRFMLPFSLDRKQRKIIRVLRDKLAHLAVGKSEARSGPYPERFFRLGVHFRGFSKGNGVNHLVHSYSN